MTTRNTHLSSKPISVHRKPWTVSYSLTSRNGRQFAYRIRPPKFQDFQGTSDEIFEHLDYIVVDGVDFLVVQHFIDRHPLTLPGSNRELTFRVPSIGNPNRRRKIQPVIVGALLIMLSRKLCTGRSANESHLKITGRNLELRRKIRRKLGLVFLIRIK